MILSRKAIKNDHVGYYAQRATEYERTYARPERQEDLRCLRGLVGNFFQGDDVLEVACGAGYWTEAIAPFARSIFAADSNKKYLALARAKDFGGAAVEFLKADCYALPKFDGLFTAGFGGFWWSRIPRVRLQEFLTGFHAHLAPGAKVAFIDSRYIEGRSTPVIRHGVNGHADTYQMRSLGDGHVHQVLKNFPSPQELESTVSDFGYNIKVTLFDYHWLLTYQNG
jgi:demethylmenaquinone methyltransferase/2-methoxy-6-polyprenyl-1,4-benzoquinol methylase